MPRMSERPAVTDHRQGQAVAPDVIDPTSPLLSAATTFDDATAVRTSAQWMTAAAGAVAAALVAGLQFGDVGELGDRPVALVVAFASFLTALSVVGLIIRRSSQVLVSARTTVSDLLEADTIRDLHGITVAPPADTRGPGKAWFPELSRRPVGIPRPGSRWQRTGDQLQPVVDEISRNRDWLLLPEQRTTSQLNTEYQSAQLAAARGDEGAAVLVEHLEHRLATVCAFARAELTRNAYRRLADTVTGWPGWVFAATALLFAATLSWPHDPAPRVTAPYRLDVLLTGTPRHLRDAGLASSCQPGTRLTGVALAGDLTEPAVVTEAVSGCPAARFAVTRDVGIPIPYVSSK